MAETSKDRKQRQEKDVFLRFAKKLGQTELWIDVENRPEPEPDLLCTHVVDGKLAFELVSLTDESVAKRLVTGPAAFGEAFSTADPSRRIILAKLKKKYETSSSKINLLVYVDGRIITPDDVIIPTILPLFESVSHPFSSVWFMGEFTTQHICSSS